MALKPRNALHSPGHLKAAPPSLPVDHTWRLRWLLAAPHRLAFFGAAMVLSFSALWWSYVLFARAQGLALPWALAPANAHALVMTFSFMPLFIAGFLFTAGPKWLGLPAVPARQLLAPVLASLVGWGLGVPGFHQSALLAAAGMAVVALAWTAVTGKFLALWRKSRAADKVHTTVVVYAASAGVLAMWVAALGLASGQARLVQSATQMALWMFIAPIFASVSHRMIPFFGASAVPALDAWRPLWLLWCMVAVLGAEGLMAGVDLWWRPVPGILRWLQVLLEGPAALLLLWLAIRWGLVQSLKIRLLAMLHGGFLWLGIALALQATSHTLMALSPNSLALGLAPLHALTMGYLGVTMLAMTTRVASGHGGRPLAADNLAWTLYLVLQTAVVLRVLAALWVDAGTLPLLLAATAWTLATCGWALRYGRWLGRPRLDGRPG